jgi:maltose alpha-D-glucosyltransferase / alpha-amylase
MAVRMEDRQPIVDILEQTPPIPETSQWALFLRNHDELTLEMVTDEERDYMYRMYAHVDQARLNLGIRRRLAPLVGNDRKSIELLNALLFSLPGTPVLYYGDEIGLGENIFLGDRNGVRTPMQWSSDKNAGFSRANPQSLYLPIILDPGYHYEANNVEVQLANPHSLLWWMRRLLALRKRWRALGEGKCEFLQPDNRKILSYILRYEKKRFWSSPTSPAFRSRSNWICRPSSKKAPIELFGRTEFPAITERPYFLSLGPHSFYWFSLENRFDMKEILPDYLRAQTWFKGKSRTIKLFTFKEAIPMKMANGAEARLAFPASGLRGWRHGDVFTAFGLCRRQRGGWAASTLSTANYRGTKIGLPAQSGILYDAFGSPDFCAALLE